MKEPFSAFAALIVTVIGLFIVPLLYFAQKQDSITQAYVYTRTVAFVQDVQENGYISQDMYNTFTHDLSNTDIMYDISMEHVKLVDTPIFNDTGTGVAGTTAFESANYEDSILEKLYQSNGKYYLEVGDFFSMTVKNRSNSIGQKMQKLLHHASGRYSIVSTYGGRIRNENY